MREELVEAQRKVAEIAARQHGVATTRQILSAGMPRSTLSRRAREGWLHRVQRGVYAVGNPNLSREGHWMAAVLACGAGAVISHGCAAVLHSISPTCPEAIHITVPVPGGRSRRRGIVIHRSTTLTRAEVTRRRGIPVTSYRRTLADLGYGPERTRSDLERLFLRICLEHDIPKPEVNVPVGPYTVDFLWRAERLVVEVDGYRYHSDRRAFRSDRARDRYLGGRAFAVLRFADEELEDPPAVAASVKARLP